MIGSFLAYKAVWEYVNMILFGYGDFLTMAPSKRA